MGLRPRVIELHIDELMLEGPEASSREATAAALEAELGRLLVEHPPASDLQGFDRLPVAALEVTMQAPPAALGAAIARSVHGGLAP